MKSEQLVTLYSPYYVFEDGFFKQQGEISRSFFILSGSWEKVEEIICDLLGGKYDAEEDRFELQDQNLLFQAMEKIAHYLAD